MLKEIYEEHKQDVYTYLISLTRNPSLSEDLLSETFIGALKSINRFKGESSIKTWLFSIARNKWYEHLRREKEVISIDDLTYNYLVSGDNLEITIINKELYKKILDILDNEKLMTRDIVIMRVKGYSYLEISNKHNISESSARVVDYRAKNKIKRILAKEGYVYE